MPLIGLHANIHSTNITREKVGIGLLRKMIPKLPVLLIFTFPSLYGTVGQSQRNYDKKAVVELLIVCDRVFVERFQNDRHKIYEFWSTQMWDVNMRLQTLATNLGARVVNIVLLQSYADQPFIDNRNKTGDFRDHILNGFANWLFELQSSFSYDIAILASGVTENNVFPGWSWSDNVCINKHYSSGLVLYEFPYRRFITIISNTIVMMIGATLDSKTQSCTSGNFALGDGMFTDGRFFYSHCTDDAVNAKLQKGKAQCLLENSSEAKDALKQYAYAIPPSLDTQCKAMTKNEEAYAADTDNRCVKTSCYIRQNNATEFGMYIWPVDNTPCETDSNCFRGRCLPQGYQLRNLHSNQCIHSSNRFSGNDPAIFTLCKRYPTPLDTLRIETDEFVGVRLLSPYSPVHTTKNHDKCLTVEKSTKSVHYSKCSKQSDERWSLIKSKISRWNFMLFNRLTNLCLMADRDGNLSLSVECNSSDRRFLWTTENKELPDNLLERLPGTREEVKGKNDFDPKNKADPLKASASAVDVP